MFCKNCGNEINPNAVVCVKCGASVVESTSQVNNANNEVISYAEASGGLKFLCFLIPVLGIIMYAIEHVQRPIKAKNCLKAAIIGFVFSFICSIIYGVIVFLTF